MRSYNRITSEDREKIYFLKQNDTTQSEMASFLGKSQSSISYELSRCRSDLAGYLPHNADLDAISKYKKYHGKLTQPIKAHITHYLKIGWSPEQIAGRLKYERDDMLISHETIYKFIYSDEGQAQKLSLLLLRRRIKRGSRYGKKPRQHNIPASASIECRPKDVEKRKKKGHWEVDLVVFTALKSSNVTTALERKSRYVELIYNPNKYTKTVIGNLDTRLKTLPLELRKTVTFDRGSEFASYRDLDMDSYFCNPHSPWQKGSNENFNGRLRKHLPKHFNNRNLKQELLDEIQHKMNNQPRKCLGFKTPIEVLFYQQSRCKYRIDP